ncbi:hypothetical protein FOA52_007035 [Chlamydomonas sp. UWO 241]|nr:hypothetical protein FOA52_007035 [Chlamydomonas sp. UWO 241]
MPQAYRAIRPMFGHNQWRIYVDDVVQVVTGSEKGATGRVLQVIKDNKQPEVVVEGVNMRKKKIFTGVKPDEYFVVSMEAPLHYSNIMLVDPVSKKPVRTVLRYLPDGTKVRLGLGPDASEQVIPIPRPLEDDSKLGLCAAKDTPQDVATRVTYDAMAQFPFRPPPRLSGLPMPSEVASEQQPQAFGSSSSGGGGGEADRPSRSSRPGAPPGPWDPPDMAMLAPGALGMRPRAVAAVAAAAPRKTLAEHARAAKARGIHSVAWLGLQLGS